MPIHFPKYKKVTVKPMLPQVFFSFLTPCTEYGVYVFSSPGPNNTKPGSKFTGWPLAR